MFARPRPLFALVLLLSVSVASVASAENPWTGFSGTSFLALNPAVLGDLGIEVFAVETADPEGAATSPQPSSSRSGVMAFSIVPSSSVRVRRTGEHFKGFESGMLRHAGGVVLRLPDGSLSLLGFSLRAAKPEANFDLLDAAGRRWLILDNMQWESSADGSQLWLIGADVLLAPELAERLGRPDLTEAYIGVMDVALPSPPPVPPSAFGALGGGGPCDPDLGLPKDIELIDIAQLSQAARQSNVRVAMAPSAKLRNVGVGAVPWFQTIEPDASASEIGDHPYLAMHFYRLANGAIEQLGRSAVKHAYFSVNSNCSCAPGRIIFPTCEDTYGVNTNLDQIHLGPRDELSAATGLWERVGSHFDALPVDDFRDHQGDVDHDNFEHRLVVAEPELETPGAAYFVEAWYIVQDDLNIWNSMGHRSVSPNLMGNTWSFTLGGTGPTLGSVLDEWVDPVSPPAGSANITIDTGEGHLQVAVSSTDLGGGVTAYEYALMNFDFDARIRSFVVPIVSGTTVTNLGFRGAEKDPLTDWTSVVRADSITWTAPLGEELGWGTLFNFRFEADAPPQSTVIDLGISDPASGTTLAVASIGPAPPPECSDGLDNDGDGVTDFDGGLFAGGPVDPDGPDPQCPTATRNREASAPFCAMGIELMLILPLLVLGRSRRARRSISA